MSYSNDRMLGHREGVRAAITWLHARAREMNDPTAKTVLNTAAFNMGVDLAQFREVAQGPLSSGGKP
jgi:hypothetical protein